MLGLQRFRSLWQPSLEPYEDEPEDIDALAPLWKRPARVPTDQERQAADTARKAYVQRLSVDNPFRPVLKPHVRTPEPSVATEPPQRTYRASTDAPSAPGIYLTRQYAWQAWTTTEVVIDVAGVAWMGWGDGVATPVATARLEWLAMPGLDGVPRG